LPSTSGASIYEPPTIQTGAEIEIAAAKVPTFKAGKTLKDEVNA
jgi:nucleoid DNA-binding protein